MLEISSYLPRIEAFDKLWLYSEIFGNLRKISLSVCLYNKQNNAWLLEDMEYLFSCSTLYLTSETLSCPREETFHIYACPCIILYILFSENPLLSLWYYSLRNKINSLASKCMSRSVGVSVDYMVLGRRHVSYTITHECRAFPCGN